MLTDSQLPSIEDFKAVNPELDSMKKKQQEYNTWKYYIKFNDFFKEELVELKKLSTAKKYDWHGNKGLFIAIEKGIGNSEDDEKRNGAVEKVNLLAPRTKAKLEEEKKFVKVVGLKDWGGAIDCIYSSRIKP